MANVLPMPSLTLRDFDGVPIWTDEALFDESRVRIAFTGRAGGVSEDAFDSLNLSDSVGDRPINVGCNRARIAEVLGMDEIACVQVTQVHGTDILSIGSMADAMRFAAREQADAIHISIPGLASQILAADCLPLILIAPDGTFVDVHAGWRGVLEGIAGNAVRRLAEASGETPADFNAYIGPHIHPECFELDVETAGRFQSVFGEEALVDPRHVSMARAVEVDLVRAGMSAERIADCDVCTVCHANEYFSYRASGGECGRNGAIVFKL